MKVSLVATVLNEEASISGLMDSVLGMTRLPDEVIVVDGGSRDRTVALLEGYQGRLPLRLLVKPGCNISQGRNAAIAAATGEVIACTDGGVRLAPCWLEALVEPLEAKAKKRRYNVACGFFAADPHSPFELALGATVLPSLEEIDPERFLPSSRSVAYTKKAWAQVGGYPEWLDYCEDLVFDLRLKKAGFRFAWVPQALAYFRPRTSLAAFFKQYYRYARGDGKADLWRRRHAVRYSAYLGGAALLALAGRWWWTPALVALAGAIYLKGPYRRLLPQLAGRPRVEALAAIAWVPLIRLSGDVAKMLGYPSGLWWRLRQGSALDPSCFG